MGELFIYFSGYYNLYLIIYNFIYLIYLFNILK